MKEVKEIKGKITVSAELYAKYKKIQAEKSALEKSAKALLGEMGLPEASEETTGSYLLVNGNQDEMGKVSIYHKAEFMMPACYIRRVS